MVQKTTKTEPGRSARGRGRPRSYDPETALRSATETFWRGGFSGTSLDDIAAATGMNKPSLYAAFGDKHALYLEVLSRYWQLAFASMREALAEDLPLDEALMRVYDGAMAIYFSGAGPAQGCFVVGTAVTEALEDREIRDSLAAGIRTFDAGFETRFRRAREQGELKKEADPAALAVLATAMMHTIAIRARAGIPRAELRELASKAVEVICG
ncbi:TetR/AcrR family transcriptional regulator [Dongia soli]|uniref:TetR/AcrR family transcriptional regulator n=1 Tax=Dongia soli TaxID=600628 RepID=A0ABU5E7K4_9PROT|nr:TetR/AcrR family transcriptional regulator [Dongia soli]MDY0882004.1 TetR/AcrR family transcriptional regulator [Dongia soli]